MITLIKIQERLQSTIISDESFLEELSKPEELYILSGERRENKKNCSVENCNGYGNINLKNQTHRR